MRKSPFSEAKIVSILREAETGRKVKGFRLEYGISTALLLTVEVEVWQP